MDKQLDNIKSNQKQLVNTSQANQSSSQYKIQQQEEKVDDKNMLKFLDSKMKEMETEFDIEENVVIDLGSAFTKIGFSGEDLPRAIIPSIYSSLKSDPNKKTEINLEKNQHLYGYDIFYDKDKYMYDIRYLKQGDHEDVIDHDFYFLLDDYFKKENITPVDHNIIINASPIKNKQNIMALTKLFLDEFNFKGLSIINSSSLALFATGRTSGLVIDCGESKTQCVPIYEGFPLYHALNTFNLGGKNVSDLFLKGIIESYPEFDPENIISIREIKEKMAYVSYLKDSEYYIKNDKEDILREEQRLYKLPDGERIIEIPKKYRLNASELLFNPSIIGSQEKGLLSLISDSIKKTVIDNEEIKNLMFSNIVLAGGTSMMKGFPNKIQKYLPSLLDNTDPNSIFIVDDNQRHLSTWIGASMISSMSTFSKLLINKETLLEIGEDRIGVGIYKKIF